ncbi:MAG: asparaginase, partial [Desulfovibrionaceae bacterium]|nr:asparaginase [Desulfovibrionaceae bacterium]
MPTAQQTAGRPKLLVFSTGGTIAMQAGEEGIKPRDRAGIAGLPSNLNAVFEEIVFSNLPSPHMTLENWLKLAAAIDASLKSPEVAGAVVLHGTDLLPECALTLKLCLSAEKPVVVTGSMHAQGEAGYDGLRNLENAAAICLALPGCKNVFACMGDEIFSARTVFKQNSVAPASMSAHDGLLGRVVNKEA